MIIDRFVVGTKEYDDMFNYLFNNYFPNFKMELVSYDNYSEIYKINDMHRVTATKGSEILVEKYYYYYNK